MAKFIKNNPSPDVLMNSMRSIGYSFKSAVADIIDNSISAKATEIEIYTPINDELFISFFDNGEGMDRDELLNAMKYGSNRDSYTESDLGRFGLGLKSASLSQCRRLTVASKKNGKISAFQWDLDNVMRTKEWDCLELDDNEIDSLPSIEKIINAPQGTLVVWQDFDIAYKKSNGHVRETLSEEMEEAEHHLSLIFHRFINNTFNPLKIFINGDKIVGFDPFLEDHPKTDSQKPSTIKCEGEDIKIQQFILPHQNDLSNEDIDKLGGIDLLRNGQGFYIYRNNRLIIYGTWFRLASSNLNSELYKYGRIKVDISNKLDDIWDIDIKKQNASIPRQILSSLKKAVSNVRTRSRDKSAKRTRLNLEKDDSKIWNKSLNRDNKEVFFINSESEYIKNFINEFDDKDKTKIVHFLEVLSSAVPYDDIYNSMCNRALEQKISQDGIDSIVLEGVNQFHYLKRLLQLPDEQVFEVLKTYEPFDKDDILQLVKERIGHGR